MATREWKWIIQQMFAWSSSLTQFHPFRASRLLQKLFTAQRASISITHPRFPQMNHYSWNCCSSVLVFKRAGRRLLKDFLQHQTFSSTAPWLRATVCLLDHLCIQSGSEVPIMFSQVIWLLSLSLRHLHFDNFSLRGSDEGCSRASVSSGPRMCQNVSAVSRYCSWTVCEAEVQTQIATRVRGLCVSMELKNHYASPSLRCVLYHIPARTDRVPAFQVLGLRSQEVA